MALVWLKLAKVEGMVVLGRLAENMYIIYVCRSVFVNFLSYIHIKIREVADVATQQFGVHVGELGVATDSWFVWWKRKTLGKQRVTLHFDSSLTWACLAEKACAHRPEILSTSNQCCQPNWGLGIGSWTTWAANLANLLYAFGNAIGVVAPGDGARSCRRMAEKDVKD